MPKLDFNPAPPLADVITGSAEDSLCKLKIDLATFEISLVKRIKLKASGVSDIAIRQDGRIFAAAGWDHSIRVFSSKTCIPLAVLQVIHISLHLATLFSCYLRVLCLYKMFSPSCFLITYLLPLLRLSDLT